MEMALGMGPDVFVRQSRALSDQPDHRDVLGAYTGQTLILGGSKERLGRGEQARKMAALAPGARQCLIADAGVLPTLEQPEKTTAEIRRWLDA